jgi:hypothetical protein
MISSENSMSQSWIEEKCVYIVKQINKLTKRSWDKSGLSCEYTKKSRKHTNFKTQVKLMNGLKENLE